MWPDWEERDKRLGKYAPLDKPTHEGKHIGIFVFTETVIRLEIEDLRQFSSLLFLVRYRLIQTVRNEVGIALDVFPGQKYMGGAAMNHTDNSMYSESVAAGVIFGDFEEVREPIDKLVRAVN